MAVYWEDAFAENFILDAVLLYLAIISVRGKVRLWRLATAAAVGGAEAVVFPLIPFPVWCAYLVKIAGGILLVLLAYTGKSFRKNVLATAAFFALTFALGGMLTAAYSFFGIERIEGNGYWVEQAPVALTVGLALAFVIMVSRFAKVFYRYRRVQRGIFACRLEQGGRSVSLNGFADSGNCLFYEGRPACVVSAAAVYALLADSAPVGMMRVGTVCGSRDSPVYLCDKLIIGGREFSGVPLVFGTVGKEYRVILHTSYVEGDNEKSVRRASYMVERKGRAGKRRSLLVRK